MLWQFNLLLAVNIMFVQMSSGLKFRISEYCEYETFNATCGADEIILMRHARYGRMRVSRCAKLDYGHIGCGSDVLHLADARCSGRRVCQIAIPDSQFGSVQPCPDDLKNYLEATYQCIRVAASPQNQCLSSRDLRLSSERGYISNLAAQDTGCGTVERPWNIQLHPGQRINISLLDFGGKQGPSTPGIKQCRVYAVIKERSVDRARNISMCSNTKREEHVYYSATNNVEVGIVRYSRLPEHIPAFLLKYAAVGCPNLAAPEGGWLSHTESGVMIGCNYTKQAWRMKCIGTTWVGDVGNCSQVSLPRNKHMRDTLSPISYGTSILIIIGVALCIGIVVLLFGLLLVKKQTRVLCGSDDAVSDLSDEVEGEKLTTTEAQYVQYQWVKRGEVAPGCTQQPPNQPTTHCVPGKDAVPVVASPEIAALSAANRDNDYGIVTVNDVRPCTPLLNKGSRSQTLYGHVGIPGQHCVCAHMSPSACKARHDACGRPGADVQNVQQQQAPGQASTIARQPIGAQYFLLDPDVIADQRANQQPATAQHPVRMFTLRGSRENGLDETYQMRTFKPATSTSTTTSPSTASNPPAYQVHPKPSITHVRDDKVAPLNVPNGAPNCDAAPNSKESRISREIERTDNQENEIRTQNSRATAATR